MTQRPLLTHLMRLLPAYSVPVMAGAAEAVAVVEVVVVAEAVVVVEVVVASEAVVVVEEVVAAEDAVFAEDEAAAEDTVVMMVKDSVVDVDTVVDHHTEPTSLTDYNFG